MEKEKRFLRIEEAADLAEISARTLRNWISMGTQPFPVSDMGAVGAKKRTIRIPKKPFENWLREKEKFAVEQFQAMSAGAGP